MAFNFRFKSLLKHRNHLLQEAQSAMAAAQLKQREVQGALDRLLRRTAEQYEQLEARQRQGIDAATFFYFKHYLRTLQHEALLLERDLEKANVEVGRRKLVVIEKDKAVKRLEVLEEQDREQYRRFQLLREQKLLDEVAIIRDSRDRHTAERE